MQVYERLAQPRRRNNNAFTSQNTNGSKEGSTENRKTAGSQKGSVKQRSRRVPANGMPDANKLMERGKQVPTTLLR